MMDLTNINVIWDRQYEDDKGTRVLVQQIETNRFLIHFPANKKTNASQYIDTATNFVDVQEKITKFFKAL